MKWKTKSEIVTLQVQIPLHVLIFYETQRMISDLTRLAIAHVTLTILIKYEAAGKAIVYFYNHFF